MFAPISKIYYKELIFIKNLIKCNKNGKIQLLYQWSSSSSSLQLYAIHKWYFSFFKRKKPLEAIDRFIIIIIIIRLLLLLLVDEKKRTRYNYEGSFILKMMMKMYIFISLSFVISLCIDILITFGWVFSFWSSWVPKNEKKQLERKIIKNFFQEDEEETTITISFLKCKSIN